MMDEITMRMRHAMRRDDGGGAGGAGGAAAAGAGAGGVYRELLYPELSHRIVGAAIEVHRRVGPGKLEAVYQRALGIELEHRGIEFVAQAPIAIGYRGKTVGEFAADFIVEERVVVELKSVERMQPVFVAQTLSYLRASGLRLGLIVNFNVPVLWKGVRRVLA